MYANPSPATKSWSSTGNKSITCITVQHPALSVHVSTVELLCVAVLGSRSVWVCGTVALIIGSLDYVTGYVKVMWWEL